MFDEKGTIIDAELHLSDTNNFHVHGRLINSEEVYNGITINTSRIISILPPSEYDEKNYLVQTKNSLYIIDGETAKFTLDQLEELDSLGYNLLVYYDEN